MSDFITKMYLLDQNLFILVGMICIWATLIVNKALDHTIITVVSLPTFLNFALATIVVLEDFQVVLSFDRNLNVIMFAGIGIVVALLFMVGVFVVSTTFIDLRDRYLRSRMAAYRDLDRSRSQPRTSTT